MRKIAALPALAAVLTSLSLSPANARAATRPQQTGQTACWSATGSTVACAGTGQDGDSRAGAPLPTPRFTDNGNGTVTDNFTRLVWLKDSKCQDTVAGIYRKNGLGAPLSTGLFTWDDALAWSTGMASGHCGLTDGSSAGQWRLPNMNEMTSLVALRESDVMLPAGNPFANTGANPLYWTSTSAASFPTGSTGKAWTVGLYSLLGSNMGPKGGYSNAWPVRDSAASSLVPGTGQTASYASGDDGDLGKGVAWPSPRFSDQGNGTVVDNLTGLTWMKNANCTETAGGIAKGAGTLKWSDALTWSNNLKNGSCGLADGSSAGQWRLPNFNELSSLLDYSIASMVVYPFLPIIPAGHPFANVQANSYWSSTTDSASHGNAWSLTLASGLTLTVGKSDTRNVWAVRTPAVTIYPGDCDKDGAVSAVEVRSAIGMSLGVGAVTSCVDSSGDGSVRAAEAQKVIGSFGK